MIISATKNTKNSKDMDLCPSPKESFVNFVDFVAKTQTPNSRILKGTPRT